MPLDTRRITGPEVSQSPYDFRPAASKAVDLKTLVKQRADGRGPSQLRPLFLKSGVISQARGSAYIEMDHTKVICAVYGPREVMRREDFSLKGQLTCDLKFTTFSCTKRRQHQQDNQERDFSVHIVEAIEPAICLHKYPKSQINIYVTVLQNDGSALSAAITCASVALATAGVEMFDLVLATSTAIVGQETIADPTAQEEEAVISNIDIPEGKNAGCVTLAYLPSLRQVSALTSDGEISFDVLNQSMKFCMDNCQKLYPVMRQALTQHLLDSRTQKT